MSSKKISALRDDIRRYIGRKLFDRGETPLTETKLSEINRVLIVRWDAKLGDSIISSFFFRELKKHRPSISAEVITTEGFVDLYGEFLNTDQVYVCQKRPSYKKIRNLANEIGQVDVVIHFSKKMKMRDMYLLHYLSPKVVMGLDDELDMINRKLGGSTSHRHFSEKYVAALEALGIPDCDESYIVPWRKSSEDMVRKYWPNSDVIALNPFGGSKSRCLNFETIRMLVKELSEIRPDTPICFLFPPDKRQDVSEWVDTLSEYNVFFIGSCDSIFDSIEIVRLARAVVSVDTAIVHIASGLGKPLLAIYNSDEYHEWHPNLAKAVVLFSHQREDERSNVNNIMRDEVRDGLTKVIDVAEL